MCTAEVPSKPGPCAGAAAHGLVVLVRVVAEDDVVHRPLARREHAEGAVERVGHRLAGLGVPGHDGSRILRRQHGALGNDDVDRLETALVQRNVVVHQGAEDVEHGRAADRRRRVEVGRPLRAGAGEVDGRLALLLVEADLHLDLAALVQRIGELAIRHHVDDAAHLLLRIVLDVAHVGVHHVEAELLDHAVDLADAPVAGGDLRLEIGDVVVRLARGVAAGGQVRAQLVLQEHAGIHQLEVVEEDALLLHGPAVRRRGARRAPADIGVMAAARDEEQDLLPRLVEDRRDDGDVRQVGAAVVGRVHHVDIAGLQGAAVLLQHRAHRLAHRAQVNRDMRRIGDQIAVGVEHRAGEIEPLLDVHRIGGVLQRHAHLLGDRHEEVVEHLQHHRVALGAHREGALQGARHG